MALRMNGARENLHARNPGLHNFAIGSIHVGQLAGFDPDVADALSK